MVRIALSFHSSRPLVPRSSRTSSSPRSRLPYKWGEEKDSNITLYLSELYDTIAHGFLASGFVALGIAQDEMCAPWIRTAVPQPDVSAEPLQLCTAWSFHLRQRPFAYTLNHTPNILFRVTGV